MRSSPTFKLAVLLVIVGAGAAAFSIATDLFREKEDPMERLMQAGLVERISGDTVFVSRPKWISLSREGKRTFTRYAAEYTPNEGVLVVDGVSGRSLAEVSEGEYAGP